MLLQECVHIYTQINILIFISQNMVRIVQYIYYNHGSIQKYVKNAWVSGPDKTLKGWYSKC